MKKYFLPYLKILALLIGIIILSQQTFLGASSNPIVTVDNTIANGATEGVIVENNWPEVIVSVSNEHTYWTKIAVWDVSDAVVEPLNVWARFGYIPGGSEARYKIIFDENYDSRAHFFLNGAQSEDGRPSAAMITFIERVVDAIVLFTGPTGPGIKFKDAPIEVLLDALEYLTQLPDCVDAIEAMENVQFWTFATNIHECFEDEQQKQIIILLASEFGAHITENEIDVIFGLADIGDLIYNTWETWWSIIKGTYAGNTIFHSDVNPNTPPPPIITPTAVPIPTIPTTSAIAQFIADITLPTASEVEPNQSLPKIWRVKNSGQVNWLGYKLIFSYGNQMGAPSSIDIPFTSAGETIDISLPIITPFHTSNSHWLIVDGFGTAIQGGELHIELTVNGSTPPPSPANYTLSCTNCPSMVEPGASFLPNIKATIGSGQLLESRGDMLRHKSGELYGAWHHVAVQGVVNPNTSYDFTFYANNPITAPSTPGTYQNTWQLWQNGQWVGPEYTLTFEVGGQNNNPPNTPTLTGPGDWAVYYGNTGINLSAQHNGDPDGDAVNEYYFEIFESAQNMNSGWITSNTWTPEGLPFNGYQWRVKVRDSRGAESGWSNLVWHFSVMNNDPVIDNFHAETCRESWGGAEKICFCAQTNAGTLRLQVNMASDGSDDGEWVVLNELGVPNYTCNTDDDRPPNWAQLEGESGTHLVRLYARRDGGWENAAHQDITVSLPANRRPNEPMFVEPPRQSYVNSLTVHLDWEESLRTDSYQLEVADNSGFTNPVVNTTLPAGTTEYNVTLPSAYPTVYWRVTATGPHGSHANDTYFYTDIVAPTSAAQALPPVTSDTRLSINWSGSDDRSGIRWYHVQVRDGNRPDSEWVDWLVNTSQTAELFDGQPGHTYYFRVRAMDLIGNWENWPAGNGDTYTLIDTNAAPTTPWWDANYAHKRAILVINQDADTMPIYFPVGIRFDENTNPTAAEVYEASLSTNKGDDIRVVYNNTTELNRFMTKFTSSEIEIWFPLQSSLGGSQTDNTSYQMYYGYAGANNPPNNTNEVFLPKTDANTMMLAHFQEGTGSTVNDSSGRNHHGNFISPGWIDGYLGTAGLLNGSTSKIDFGNHSDFNVGAMTLEAWVYITANTGAYEHIFDKEKYWFRVSNSRQPQLNAFETRADGVCPNLQLNTWYHLAATYNGSNRARIYVNGDMCNEKIESHAPNHTSASFMVGAEHVPAPLFPGYIQHIRVSNIERTDFSYAKITVPPSVAVGSVSNPPNNQPLDLAILDLRVYPNLEGGLLLQAIVQNQSEASTGNGFFTDLYVDHLPTGAGDYTNSLSFWVNTSIEPSATVTLTTLITDFVGMGTVTRHSYMAGEEVEATLYAQTDSTGVISEEDNSDNIYDVGLSVCIAASDSYEGDDTYLTATTIGFNQAQTHNFHKLSDQDWFKIQAQEDVVYTLYTYNLDMATDTYLYLYDEDGTTLLASNDDSDGSLASRIDWTAPATGTYYVAIKHWNPNVAGCKNSYTFKFKEFGNDIYLPIVTNLVSDFIPTPLQNGGFEAGPNVGWQEYSSNGWGLVLHSSNLSGVGVTPYEGEWASWLGGADNEISIISQQVTIPTDNPSLYFWYWVGSEDYCGYDYWGITVNGDYLYVFDLCESTVTNGWWNGVVDLSMYSGQTVELGIRVETDGSLNSNLFIDYVTLGNSFADMQSPQVSQNRNITVGKEESFPDYAPIKPISTFPRIWSPRDTK
jgi:hypothetical protein